MYGSQVTIGEVTFVATEDGMYGRNATTGESFRFGPSGLEGFRT